VILDGHVTIGDSRDVSLPVDMLLRTMDELAIARALVSPPEFFQPVRNREGNELVAAAARSSFGRLLPYAVATPWLGADALDELARAREGGAVALKLSPSLQGFDPLDGLVDPLLDFAADAGWPVYLTTGTPPHALPLQVACLAERHPNVVFLLGKSGATDFSHDGPATLAGAENVLADSAWVEWPTALAASDPARWGGRVVFTTDAPFADAAVELERVTGAGLPAAVEAAVLGGTLAAVLGL
jgi:predicted TIM-barrel fold metal-dependent hydrolase